MNSRILLILFFAFVPFLNIFAQDPGGVSGATLWLKASEGVTASGDQVSQWNNQVAGGVSAEASKSASANVIREDDIFNGLPAIKFDGTSGQYLSGTLSSAFSGPTTLFVVCRRDGAPVTATNYQSTFSTGSFGAIGGKGIVFDEASGSYLLDAENPSTTNSPGAGTTGVLTILKGIYIIANETTAGVMSANGVNGTVNATGILAYTNSSSFRIGGRTISNDAVFNGYIAEIIAFPSNISTTPGNIEKIESYLALKYGITLDEGNSRAYVSSDGTTIWSGDAGYQHDIFGVGQDDGSGLLLYAGNSINSGSGDFTGQTGKGNVMINASSFTNNQFLVVGNNGLAATIDDGTNVPGTLSGYSRSSRIWHAEETGFDGNVTLKFNFSGLNVVAVTDPADIKLLVSSTADMTDATAIDASSVAGDEVTFDAVNFPSSSYFSFAFLNTVLPIKFTGFKVVRNNNYNSLQWTTANETGYDRYEAEHSPDGINFSVIASLPHTQNVTSYSYNHTTDEPGIHYYRIAGFDKEGIKTYTSVQSVRISNLQSFRIAPNPVKETLTLQVNAKRSAKVYVRVLNAEGKQVLLNSSSLAAGMQHVQLNTRHLAAGTYILQVTTKDETITRRFLRIL